LNKETLKVYECEQCEREFEETVQFEEAEEMVCRFCKDGGDIHGETWSSILKD
jgi:DNA-directed RNA polymerase subunit RPC12/RpoP